MKTLNELIKRNKQTIGLYAKPLTKSSIAAMKVTVKNVISDLDLLNLKLDGQNSLDAANIHTIFPVIKKIDVIVKEMKAIEKELKKVLKV